MSSRISFPHPMVIMLGFVFIAMIMTFLIPAGRFERVVDADTGREVVVQGSYSLVPNQPVGLGKTFLSVPEGIIAGAEVVVLILIIGGAFYVVEKTGAFQAGLEYLIFHFDNAKPMLLTLVGLFFAVVGALNGLQEEIIAMVPVLIILTKRIGYTKTAGVAISLGCALIGGAFGPSNPFSVILAQQLAEIPVFSASLYRIAGMIIALIFWISYVIKTGKDPMNPILDKVEIKPIISPGNSVILLLVALTFSIMIYGLTNWGWDYNEMSASFFLTSTVVSPILL
jgi:uncharacterized ion transporter superfamily protein YfcC